MIRPALALDRIALVDEVAGRYILYRLDAGVGRCSIGLGHGVSCCYVSVSDVATVMLQLYLLLMVTVTSYRVWAIQVILIRTVETKTTVHIQLVVVKTF